MDRYLYIDGVRHVIDYNQATGDYTVGPEASLPEDAVIAGYPELVTIEGDLYASDDTNITIDEVYNKLKLTCEIKDVEEIIQSPLDDDSMYSPFTNKQHYCTELLGTNFDLSAFLELLTYGTSKRDNAKIYDWYVQVYKSKNWEFSGDKFISEDNTNQWKVLQRARAETGIAFLCAFGKNETGTKQDNSIKPAPNMKKYLVIGVNGNRVDEENRLYPSESDLESNSPIATYKGNLAGGYFSPTDEGTVNYIVISGKMIMTSSQQHSFMSRATPSSDICKSYYDGYKYVNVYAADPKRGTVMDYPTLKENTASLFVDSLWPFSTVPCIPTKDDWGDTFYTCKFYDNYTPSSPDRVRTDKNMESLYPYNSEYNALEELPYNYSSDGSEEDKYWKLPVLQCTLKIGDKYCVEITGDDPTAFPTYKWLTLDQCPTKDGVKQNHIWLGPNPKIDDNFIGKEWDLMNMVDATMNIDAKGIAIPVKYSDHLNGKVEFTIDGCCNLTYDLITRRHPTFFRHTKWYHDEKQVLGHINQIMISDFEVKIYSDNGMINNIDEADELVYMTNEANTTDVVNEKDDIEFNLTTGLTNEECAEKRVNQTVKMNNPFVGDDYLRSVVNVLNNNVGKPEEHYLTNYFNEYTQPKVKVDTTVFEDLGHDWLTHYKIPSLDRNKEFFVHNITKNVKDCTDTITVKEL